MRCRCARAQRESPQQHVSFQSPARDPTRAPSRRRPLGAPSTVHVDDRLDSQLGNVVAAARQQGAQAALRTARANGLDTVSGRIRVVVEASPGDARDAVAARGGIVEATAGQPDRSARYRPASITPSPPPAVSSSVRALRTRRTRSASKAKASRPSTAACLAHGRRPRRRSEGRRSSTSASPSLARPPAHRRPPPAGLIDRRLLRRLDGRSRGSTAPLWQRSSHEMAPAAQLYAICVDTEVDLANAAAYAVAARHHDRQPLGRLVQQLARRRQRRCRNARRNCRGGQRRRNPLGECGRERRAGALERHVVGSRTATTPTTSPAPTRVTRSCSTPARRSAPT